MKRNIKSLPALLALSLFLSCAQAPQQMVSEEPVASVGDLTSEKIRDSIVLIESENGSGTGFFVAPDKVATNIHVVAHAGPVSVKSPDKKRDWTIEGVVGFDAKNSLVILKIAGEGAPLPLGDSQTTQFGDSISIPGYPDREFEIAEGSILSIRKDNKWCKINTATSKERNGSPVLNNNGQVIAIIALYNTGSYSYAMPSSALEVLLVRPLPMEPLAEWQQREQVRARASYSLGKEKFGAKDYAGALIDFDKAIELDPTYVPAYYIRGISQAHLEDYDSAIASLTQVLKMNPEDADVYHSRGSVKARRGNYAEAIVDLDKAIELDARHVNAYRNRGAVNFRLGESEETDGNAENAQSLYEAAIADCDKAIQIDPEYAYPYNIRGAAKVYLDDFEGAMLDFNRTIEIDAGDADSYNNRGSVKSELGDSEAARGNVKEAQHLYESAIEDYTQSIAIDAEDATTYDNRGVAKSDLGKLESTHGTPEKAEDLYESAIEDLTQAIKINPKYAKAYKNRGLVKCKLGDIESGRGDAEIARSLYHEGATDYNKFIQLNNPDDVDLKDADLELEKVGNSTVLVTGWVETTDDFFNGSGFFVDKDRIATNIHVVARRGPVFVKRRDKTEIWAVEGVTAFDAERDLVILKIAGEGIPLSLGDSEVIQDGELVVVVGYPHKKHEVIKGTIRMLPHSREWFRMNPPVGSGGSGSPMLNNSGGQVVGVHAAGDKDYGYAIPSNALKPLLAQTKPVEPLTEWRKRDMIRSYAYHAQGNGKRKDEHDAEALVDYNRAIEMNPQLFYSYYQRGEVQFKLGDYKSAIADYDKAIEIAGGVFNIYSDRGLAHIRLGNYESAIADYDKAIELQPTDADVYKKRAHAKFKLGESKAAQRDIIGALQLYQSAVEDCTQAISLTPKDADAYDNRGWAHFHLGKYEAARGNMKKAAGLYRTRSE